MSISRLSARGLALIRGSFLSSILLWSLIAAAQSEGPFASFSGHWRGSGEVVGVDADLVIKPFGWKGNVATIRDAPTALRGVCSTCLPLTD